MFSSLKYDFRNFAILRLSFLLVLRQWFTYEKTYRMFNLLLAYMIILIVCCNIVKISPQPNYFRVEIFKS